MIARALLGLATALSVTALGACDTGDDEELRLAKNEDPWGDDPGPLDPPPPPAIDHGYTCESSSTVFLNIGGQHCTGVMIAADVMLTAGHCVRDGANMRDLSSMNVGVGGALCGEGSVNVQQVSVHPGFADERDPNGEVRRPAAGDLAVVRLSGPVPGATIATIGNAIPGSPSDAVTMTGFSGGTQHCANATVIATPGAG